MAVNLTNADSALKSYYLDAVSEQLNNNVNPFFAKIKQSTSDVWGKEVKKLAIYGMNGGIGAGTEDGNLTVKWIHQGTGQIMLTEGYSFDGFKTPVYFRCPSGRNLQLKINGNIVPLEVQTQGVWLDAPQGGLSSTYAGCPVRTKNNAGDGEIACWTDNGYDSDYFWYLT